MTTLVNPSISQAQVARKLPHEAEHFASLQRMAAMSPYYQWVADLFKPWLGRRILDAGCGVGNFLNQIVGHAEFAKGIDLSPINIETARERFSSLAEIEVAQLDLDEAAEGLVEHQFDTVVCLDVLEHIEHDQTLMQSLADVVRPGGHVLVKVPACPWLYGSIDVASDHYRRYTPRLLRSLAQESGLTVKKLSYMNFAGVGPYFLKSRVLKRDANFSRTFTPKQLSRIAEVMPWVKALDRLTGPFVGQSLVLAAQKPA